MKKQLIIRFIIRNFVNNNDKKTQSNLSVFNITTSFSFNYKQVSLLRFISIFLIIASTLLSTSCVHENFDVPTPSENRTNLKLKAILDSIQNNASWNLIAIKDLKSRFNSGDAPLLIDKNDVIKGYVVSSDLHQNFFQEIYIQDAPENPTCGIKIASSLQKSYTKYNKGREVYIHLKDLYLGETNSGDGITAIGGKRKLNDIKEIDVLSISQLEKQVLRSEVTETIIPNTIKIPEINDNSLGTLVRIENLFFNEELIGKPIVSINDDFDTQREILSCNGFHLDKTFIETSTFASFANVSIPSGGGYLEAIVTRDFRGDTFVLVLNSFDDVVFNDTACNTLDATTFTTSIDEDFENTTGTGNVNISGWTNFKQEGTKLFKLYDDEDTGSRAIKIGSFASRNDQTISWFITPPIDLDTSESEFFSFESSNSFSDNSDLKVLISTDWDGVTDHIATATWEELPARVAHDKESFENWVRSGDINLSSYNGTAYIGFKYIGSGDEENDGTYEIDNIKLLVK